MNNYLVRLPSDPTVIVDLQQVSLIYCDDVAAEGQVVFPALDGEAAVTVTLVGQWTVWMKLDDVTLPWAWFDDHESAVTELNRIAEIVSWGKSLLGGVEDVR